MKPGRMNVNAGAFSRFIKKIVEVHKCQTMVNIPI
jgi:hypothetical protein